MAIEYYNSVWDAIEDTPEEALNMRLRSELMARIVGRVKENGRIRKFSLDALVNLTGPAHFHLELEIEDEKEVAA